MSDPYNPLGIQTMIRPQMPTAPQPPRMTMTPYEQQLDPYYDMLMSQEKDKRNWLRPVQKVLDVLQRGQYVSANLAEQIVNAFDNDPNTRVDILGAIYDGITGKRKGSYETLLRDRLNVGQTQLFPNAPEGTWRSQVDWAKVIGLFGDIFLDPTTYVPLGGVAKGAKAAASKFADDTVRVTLRALADQPAEIIAKTIGTTDPAKLAKILAIGDTNKGIQKLAGMGGDLGRFIDKTYRDALQTGMTRTESELARLMTEQAGSFGVDKLAPEAALGIENIVQGAKTGAYQGAGTRFATRIFGKEIGVKEAGPIARSVGQQWEKFSRWFRDKNPVTSTLSDAVWGVMNRGPIGEMRRALGFRNPYQKYLRSQQLEQGIEFSRVASADSLKQSLEPLAGMSDDQINEVMNIMAKQETRSAQQVGAQLASEGGSAAARMMPGPEAIGSADPAVNKAIGDLRQTLDTWNGEERFWAQRLGEDPADYRNWYLPTMQRFREGATNVRAPRKYTFAEHTQMEQDLMAQVFGVDAQTASDLVAKNITGEVTDLRTVLANRALVHGRAKARRNLIESMKEFGVDLRAADDPVGAALKRGGRDITQLGLKNVDHPALEGYVFDYDVADIIKRTLDVTGQDLNVFQRGMKAFANWWKSIVTSTTGFHARNFISDTINLYLHRGPRAFNFDEKMMALAGVASTMAENSRKMFLGKMNIDDAWFNKYLDRRIGNMTMREFAQEMRQRGVISEATMGFDPQDIVTKITGGGKNQPIRDASRWIGNHIENTNRLHVAIMDYKDVATDPKRISGTGMAFEDALQRADSAKLDWVGRESKKISIDYQNLTDFEQNTLKNVIPFYIYTRSNLSRQIAGVFNYPELYSILPKLEDAAKYEDPNYDPALVPEWMRENSAFPTGKTDQGFTFLVPGQQLAVTGLNLIPFQWEEGRLFPHWAGENLKNEVINSTAPWIRRIASQMVGSENPYNFFYQSEMQPTADAPYLMRLFASRPGTVPLVDGLLRMAGFKNGAHIDESNGKLQIDSHMAVALQEFLPVIRQLDFAFYLPQTVIPGLEQVIENTTQAQDDYEGAAQVFQMLSYYLGIKLTSQDLEREKARLGRDIYYKAEDALNQARRQQPGYEQRSLEWQQRRNQSIRRLGG